MIPAILLISPASPILLDVDASEVDRGVIRVVETIPTSGGKKGFYFPKFIPGEHRPSGPINNLLGLHFFSGGKEIEWSRDPTELFRFVVDVPRDATILEARFAMTSEFRQPAAPGAPPAPRGSSGIAEGLDNATPNLARIKWNRLLLYPEGRPTDRIMVQPKLTPAGGLERRDGAGIGRGERDRAGRLARSRRKVSKILRPRPVLWRAGHAGRRR